MYEMIKKLLVNALSSSFLSLRIATVHGLFYILEGCILSNTVIGGISEETLVILPVAVHYLKSFVSERYISHFYFHVCMLKFVNKNILQV